MVMLLDLLGVRWDLNKELKEQLEATVGSSSCFPHAVLFTTSIRQPSST